MELLAFSGIVLIGIVAIIIATFNLIHVLRIERNVSSLETSRYELERRILRLEEWRNS